MRSFYGFLVSRMSEAGDGHCLCISVFSCFRCLFCLL